MSSKKINESMGGFFDAVAGELQKLLSADPAEQISVSWNRDQPDSAVSDAELSNLVWWSCALSVDPACRIYAGADRRTWKEMSGADAAGIDDPQERWFALLTPSVEAAAKARFGALVSCTDAGMLEDSPSGGVRVSVAVDRGGSSGPGTVHLVLSPELAVALGGEDQDHGAVETGSAPSAGNSLDILQHVEIPVSVSFGRTQMRLRDLLGLTNGSVVQLDRELGDEVEVRVNNFVIASGEVVAVDGNYGVRILKMTSGEPSSGPGNQGIRGALRAG
jgi:flagellar motor switch protein FliN/FliY